MVPDVSLNMRSRVVVHLSRTPLAGAPNRLVKSLNKYTDFHALSFVESDYKGNTAGVFSGENFFLGQKQSSDIWPLLEEAVKNASIIHIHNQIGSDVIEFLLRFEGQLPPIIYHLHSPIREGPLYVPRGRQLRLPIACTAAVSQMHPRFYPEATPLPNIVPSAPKPITIRRDDRVRILFAPSQARAGRWNGKSCKHLDEALSRLSCRNDVDLVRLKHSQPSHVLEQIRRDCDITIDEIVTGGFHQISLEGLQAGNVVVNGADEISMLTMMGWAHERPPFVRSNPDTIFADLKDLVDNKKGLSEKKKVSYDYAKAHLNPKKLIKIYEDLYNKLLDSHA